MDLNGKKLLIIAGADVHCKLVNAAKELGVYTIVTDYLPIEKAPAKKLADEYWMIDITNVDSIVKKCKEKKIDGVIAFCIDPAQLPYQQICEKLKLPCYGTKQQFCIMTNKRLFKDFCLRNGVSVIPEYTTDDIINKKVEFPILVKPNITRGSRGQTICNDYYEIDEAIKLAKSESSDSKYLVERYMGDNDDMSLSYMIIEGEPYLLKLGDRILGNTEDNLDRQQIATILPSRYANEYVKFVEPRVKNMIRKLGLRFGAVFLQGFWNKNMNELYMYDPGLRFPGGDYDIVLRHATKFDNSKAFVEFALTNNEKSCYGNPNNAYRLNGGICLIISIACKPGIITTFKGFDTIKNNPCVFSATQRYKIGDVIPSSGDIRQRVAEFVAYFPSREDVKNFIIYIYDTLEILDQSGKDMIVSKLNINKI